MPLRWSEVTPGLAIGDFTIRNAADRLVTLGADPMREVLDTAVDLAEVLGRLQQVQGAP
jgi:DNA primase